MSKNEGCVQNRNLQNVAQKHCLLANFCNSLKQFTFRGGSYSFSNYPLFAFSFAFLHLMVIIILSGSPVFIFQSYAISSSIRRPWVLKHSTLQPVITRLWRIEFHFVFHQLNNLQLSYSTPYSVSVFLIRCQRFHSNGSSMGISKPFQIPIEEMWPYLTLHQLRPILGPTYSIAAYNWVSYRSFSYYVSASVGK